MCEQRVESGAGAETGVATVGPGPVASAQPSAPAEPSASVEPVAGSGLAQEVAFLRQEVARLAQDLTELRMGRRKVILEELGGLERPLVEEGVLARRTREPRHRGETSQ